MKTKFKVLVAMLVAICITTMGTVVNAATEFSDKDKSIIVTLDEDLGIDGTKTEAIGDGFTFTPLGESEIESIHVEGSVRVLGIDQDKLNAYSKSDKSFKAVIKIKLPSDLDVSDFYKFYDNSGNETTDVSIEVINGEEYFVAPIELKGKSDSGSNVSNENCYLYRLNGYVMGVDNFKYSEKYIVSRKGGNDIDIVIHFYGVNLHSENDTNYAQGYVNKNDSLYTLTVSSVTQIPTTAELSERYCKLYLEKYQGESIEVENFGTLKYAGIQEMKFENDGLFEDTKVVYVYVNSLDNLKEAIEITGGKYSSLKFATKGGYIVPVEGFAVTDADEIPINGVGADSTYKFSDKLTITVSAAGKFDLRALEIDSTDALYKKLLEGYNKKTTIDEENYDIKDTMVFDLYKYRDAIMTSTSKRSNYSGGSKTVTFTVGSSHNGEKYVVGHLVNGEEYEHEEGIVEDGKITIEVESLSPFMLTLAAKKEDDKKDPVTPENPTTPEEPTTPENPTTPEEPTTPEVPDTKPDTDTKVDTDKKGELDETPKTGSEELVSNVVSLSSITALISLAGVVVCKKEQ